MANKEDWRTLNIDTELTEAQRALYDNMKASYRRYADDKIAFEQCMNEDNASNLPDSQELKFGYMFGKLSVAIGPKRAEKVKAVDSGRSLADWLRDKAASGDRS